MRRCTKLGVETSLETPSGGEGFSATDNDHMAIYKDSKGDIVVTRTWRQFRTVAFVPVGTITEVYTYRFKPYVVRIKK